MLKDSAENEAALCEVVDVTDEVIASQRVALRRPAEDPIYAARDEFMMDDTRENVAALPEGCAACEELALAEHTGEDEAMVDNGTAEEPISVGGRDEIDSSQASTLVLSRPSPSGVLEIQDPIVAHEPVVEEEEEGDYYSISPMDEAVIFSWQQTPKSGIFTQMSYTPPAMDEDIF
ncbi:uncharacterized protein [Neodiprion pinetum]|uniref:uncharacterized protein n=1 Tax=Neodiprion pinetum TaxID=441929 RepID=UPI001EDD6B77|nr:uncharacterized protein LOC124211023 [Neodiprion pinetum]